MEAKTMLSVVIACYNHADYVGSAIASALALEWPGDLEVVVVDDGSTDDSAEVVSHYDVQLISMPNGGQNCGQQLGSRGLHR